MKKNLIGFTTSDGQKHLGYYTPVVNPCAEYWEPDSLVKLYTDEYGKEYRDVIEEFKVDELTCYYWDEEQGSYKLLSSPQHKTLAERTTSLLSEDLVTDDKGIRMQYLRMIREWLLLNVNCTKPVYIHKDHSIHSEGVISINSESAEQIPDYIQIIND